MDFLDSDEESERSVDSQDTLVMLETVQIMTILEGRESSRQSLIGCIVKIPTKVLLNEEVATHLVQEYVYGAVYNVADVCKYT